MLKIKNSYADVFLISNIEMRDLNKKFRGKNKPTNVLAFPSPGSFPKVANKNWLGEIYLNPKYIRDHKENLEFMVIHGLLHLLGFDHVKYSDRIEMEKLEKRLLSKLISKR